MPMNYASPGIVLFQSAIPFVLPASGSIGNNGALTLGTALDGIKPACYMRFPANAIVAGSAAGWYFVIMSSTTVGVIYNNTYTTGMPLIPGAPTAFATTGPGTYTQVTATDFQAQNLVVPAGSMGVNGMLRIHRVHVCNNSAGTKTARTRFDGTTLAAVSTTTGIGGSSWTHLLNAGVVNRQNSLNGNLGDLSGFGQYVYATVNTALDKTLDTSLALGVATDWMSNERMIVELYPRGDT